MTVSFRIRTVAAVVLLLFATATARAQEDTLDVRLERVAGIQPDAAKGFYEALRGTVGRSEQAAACGLLAYPLQHASGVVADAAACVANYDTLFTIPVRRAIGRQRYEELFINESGVMIGGGEVWFAARCATKPCATLDAVRVTALNTDAARLPPPKGKVLLACQVSGQKIRVSADGTGGASLGVWYSPRFTGAPEREFAKAAPPGPATTCGSRTWVFSDNVRTYTVSELPCDAYLSPPPMGSVGRVTLSTDTTAGGEPLWCRE